MSTKFHRPRLQAALTRRAGTLGPIETHERNVLAITNRIYTLTRKRSALTRELEVVRTELRAKRRELRAVLQRDSAITVDTPDDRLTMAGAADAIDAVNARHERGSR